MSFTTEYSQNVKYDASLAAEKRWVVDVLRLPSTVASGETAPGITTGPLGASGKATANIVHGDGTNTGFATMEDAMERAWILMRNDFVLNGL